MKRNTMVRVGLAALFAAVVLTSCYAPLRDQNASLSLSIKDISPSTLSGNQAVLVLIDDSYESSLAQMLWLVNEGYHVGLSSSDADTLTTLAKDIVTNGFVKFGGYPFYQLTLTGSSGSIVIPGIPAGRSYLAKLFIFNANYTFDPKNIDQNFLHQVAYQNIVFSPGESYLLAPYQDWTVPQTQLIQVQDGQDAPPVTVHMTASIP